MTAQKKITVTDTILRDAHQSIIATRMRTEDMLPICKQLDSIGGHRLRRRIMVGKLLFEPLSGVGFCAQRWTADGGTDQREVDARLLELDLLVRRGPDLPGRPRPAYWSRCR